MLSSAEASSERGSVTIEEAIVQKIMARDFIALLDFLTAIKATGFDINKNGILHSAVALGEADMSILKLILRYPGINIDQLSARVSNRDRALALTPLQVAIVGAGINHKLIFYLLDEVGVNLHARDAAGRTALCHAIEADDFKLVQELVRREAGINISDDQGNTPLFYAIKSIFDEKFLVGQPSEVVMLDRNKNRLLMVSFLLRHGARMDASCLYKAIDLRNIELITLLLEDDPDIRTFERDDDLPVLHAIKLMFSDDNTELLVIVKKLLQQGATVNSDCFYHAIELKNVELIALLLSGEVDVKDFEENKTVEDFFIWKAIRLMAVEEVGAPENNDNNIKLIIIIAYLMQAGARFDAAFLMAAIDLKNYELVNLFLRAGLDVTQAWVDAVGKSLLHKAINQHSLILCDLLVRFGVDCNVPDREGNSPLHAAIITMNTLRTECSALRMAEKKLISDDSALLRHSREYRFEAFVRSRENLALSMSQLQRDPDALAALQGEFNQHERARRDELRRNLEANKALQELKKEQASALKKIILFLFRGPMDSPDYHFETDRVPLARWEPPTDDSNLMNDNNTVPDPEMISIPARRPWSNEILMNSNPFKIILDNQNHRARTPLYLAIEGGLLFVMELLLNNGVDPNRLDEALPETERTALQFALTTEMPGCVDVLLRGGASVCNYPYDQKLPFVVMIERWAGPVNRTDLDLSGFTQLWSALPKKRQQKLTACANSLLWYGAGIARVIPLALRAMPVNMTNSCLFFSKPEAIKEWYPNAVYTQQEFLDNEFLQANAPLKSLLECTTMAYGMGTVADMTALRLLRGFLEARLPPAEGGMSLVSLIHLTMRGRGLERYKTFLHHYDELQKKLHEIKIALPAGGVVCLDPTNRLAGSEPLRYNYRATSAKILERGELRGQPIEIQIQMEDLKKRVMEKNAKALTKKSRKKKPLGNLRFDFPQRNDDGTVQISYTITAWKLGHFYLTDRRRENLHREEMIPDNQALLAPARPADPPPEEEFEEINVPENAVRTATLLLGLPRELEGRRQRHLGPLIAAPVIRQAQVDQLQATVQNRRTCFQDLSCGLGIATFLPVYLWVFICLPFMLFGRGFCFADTIGSLFSRSTHRNVSRDEYLPTDLCWVFVAITLGLAFIEIGLVGFTLFFACRQNRLNRAERELIHDIELEALSAPRNVPLHYDMDSGITGLNNALPRIAARGEAARRQAPAGLGQQNALFARDGLWASSQASQGERDRLVINPPWRPATAIRDPYANQTSSTVSLVQEDETDMHDFSQGGYQNSLDL